MTEIPIDADQRGWQALRYFSLYRIVISGLFALLGLFDKLPVNFTQFNVRQFAVIACAYLVLAVVAQTAVERRWLGIRLQVYAQLLLDIVVITAFIRASGGVDGGFGILLVVAVAVEQRRVENERW